MMNKVKNVLIACLVASMLCCSSCDKPRVTGDVAVISQTNLEDGLNRESITSEEAISFKDLKTPTHIEKSFVQNNISISINADVSVPEVESINRIVFIFDEDNMNRIVNEWLLPAYPDAKTHTDESYDYGWGTSKEDGSVLMGFSADRDGRIGFVDASKDINGSEEEYHPLGIRYITNEIPLGMNIDAQEAEKTAITFVEKYAPFKYSALKISDVNDKQRNKGYYEIYLQPEYRKIPVCVALSCDGYNPSLFFEVCISAEGIFSFQGISNLKEIDCKSVENIMSFDSIMEYFSNDIAVLAIGTDVRVNNIYLAYIPECDNSANPEIKLIPAWCFEYTDSRIEDGQKVDMKFTVAYSVENGRVMGKFF
jgi:hypothetical protein